MGDATNFLYEDLTEQVIGCCYEVWNEFGGAFKEKIVDNALTIALEEDGLVVEEQKRIDIDFKGKKVGVCVPDKIVEQKLLLEIKSKPKLTGGDKKQFWYYLKATNYKVGLLLNFAPEDLEIYRRVYDTARSE
jgi:GxxExxY protein